MNKLLLFLLVTVMLFVTSNLAAESDLEDYPEENQPFAGPPTDDPPLPINDSLFVLAIAGVLIATKHFAATKSVKNE